MFKKPKEGDSSPEPQPLNRGDPPVQFNRFQYIWDSVVVVREPLPDAELGFRRRLHVSGLLQRVLGLLDEVGAFFFAQITLL